MTPCARCGEDASSEIYTEAGSICVCEHCSFSWFAILAGQPIETFYGEVWHEG